MKERFSICDEISLFKIFLWMLLDFYLSAHIGSIKKKCNESFFWLNGSIAALAVWDGKRMQFMA